MVVLDDTTCMVDMARFFLDFTQKESCGKCTFCRIGTRRMLETLERIVNGEGRPDDIDYLQQTAAQITQASLCGLGQTAPNPVLTTIDYYRQEYEAHIVDHRCPAASCTALVSFFIDPDKCTGCALCTKACPVGAVSGEKKAPHMIDQSKCIKCGLCADSCRFDAIEVV